MMMVIAYADVTPRTVPQEKTQTVDVAFNIKKGNEVFFNMITITGNTKTRDKVIRRQLTFNEGDLYSSSKLKSSYMALNRLRYFEEINFQTEKGPDESLTDVNINVKEKPTGSVQCWRRILSPGRCHRYRPDIPAEPLWQGTNTKPQRNPWH